MIWYLVKCDKADALWRGSGQCLQVHPATHTASPDPVVYEIQKANFLPRNHSSSSFLWKK